MQSARSVTKILSSVSKPMCTRQISHHAHEYGVWGAVAKKEIAIGLGIALCGGLAWRKMQSDRKNMWASFYTDVNSGKISTTTPK